MIIKKIDGSQLKKALKNAVGLLEKNKEEVNSLNVFPVPDGDTGTNMSLTIKSALQEATNMESSSASEIALAASKGSLMGARGNSGVILSQLFRGFASGIEGQDEIDAETLAKSLKEASDTAYKAVMKPTEGTILTVARECGEFAMSTYRENTDILIFLEKVIEHGNRTLARTPEMLEVLKQAGVVDAGGKGLMYILIGAYNSLAGLEEIDDQMFEPLSHTKVHKQDIDGDHIEFGYCTEFMVNTGYGDIESFRNEIATHGDSLMVVGGDGLIKVHVHTNNPGLVLEKGLKLGELSDIKIDNMRYQHQEILFKEEIGTASNEDNEDSERKEYSIVTISIGEGIDRVFQELNVDYIVPGGQTMNPSTEDIFNAVESTSGDNVFILPNNSNIILAAEQVKELSDRNIIVLPTKSIPEGISALLAFDEGQDVDTNTENMKENILNVKTAQITYAVRDTEFKDKIISKDDIIGLSSGEILTTGKEINNIAKELLGKIVDDEVSIITIFYGKDVSEKEAEKLAESLEEIYDEIDIELLYGGQPLYYYIFSIE